MIGAVSTEFRERPARRKKVLEFASLRKANLLVFGLAISITVSFFLLRWSQQPVLSENEVYLITAGIFVLCAILILSLVFRALLGLAFFVNFNFLVAWLLLFFLEAVFLVFPALTPGFIVEKLPGVRDKRVDIVEYLDERPWVKFRGGTLIDTRDIRGDDFVSQWTTDSLGFKNTPEIAARDSYFALALGDSYVEGTGTSINDTWSAHLSKMGYPTYNTGVQGYAPVQMLGVLEQWGPALHSDWILAGYTPGIEARETRYMSSGFLSDKLFHGGIGIVARMVEENRSELLYTNFLFTNIALDITQHQIGRLVTYARYIRMLDWIGKRKYFGQTEQYKREVDGAMTKHFDNVNPAWESAMNRYREMRDLSVRWGRKLAIVYMPARWEIYFEAIKGRPVSDDHPHRRQREALKAFSREQGIILIDTTDAFRRYIADLIKRLDQGEFGEVIPVSLLPYLSVDGHPSALGHKIVAEVVARQMKALSSPPRGQAPTAGEGRRSPAN